MAIVLTTAALASCQQRAAAQHRDRPVISPPRGGAYLSDLQRLSGDLAGPVYPKGLGTNANVAITYHLGGACAVFSAVVGIDDSTIATRRRSWRCGVSGAG